ncbi:hypothetical protein [Spirochaeta isovalerica]|uniref:Capsule assembly protein Wzi n=1 Tax=Spirochaeta isovalerica TaxID=150 RepID=A0A841RCL2_9SPIO|nr:hypothetical protein [Spirochaeta isovalerica]MBB6480730.1 hypothetical protein [Spirochaeta isovalerica]
MKNKKPLLIFIISIIFSLTIQGQTYNTVDVDESVYKILEMAEMRGIIENLSQMRPFYKAEILDYLNQMDRKRSELSRMEQTVLDSALKKYSPQDREITAINVLKQGKVQFNNEPDATFPVAIGIYFDFELRGDLNSGTIHSTNFTTLNLEGDLSTYGSYDMNASVGVNDVNVDAFSPYAYTNIATDGYYIALSSGLNGGGLVDGDEDGTSFSLMTMPELNFSFRENKIKLNYARVRRDHGNGIGNLSISASARPYSGLDLGFRPLDWFNLYFSTGSLDNWMEGTDSYGSDDIISQKMLTSQLFEFLPVNWIYFSFSSSAIWGKRFEIAYLNPLLPPVIGQSLTGDQDNISMDFSLAFKIPPAGVKIYANVYLDEITSNEGLLSDPIMPWAAQGGAKWAIPWLPFTMASFQYTRIEPYTYDHWPQEYYFSDEGDTFDLTWTNNNENLGYHLPPNSDEFLIRIESMPYMNFHFMLQYQFIRHGDNGVDGDGYGAIDNVSYERSQDLTKDFLNDGIYEKIHIATLAAAYEFENLPIWVSIDYSFNYTTNFETIEGKTMRRNILGMKLHIFP